MGLELPPVAMMVRYRYGKAPLENPFLPIETIIFTLVWPGHPIVKASSLGGATRKCAWWMLTPGILSTSISVLPVGWAMWHGHLMAHASLPEVAIKRYTCLMLQMGLESMSIKDKL